MNRRPHHGDTLAWKGHACDFLLGFAFVMLNAMQSGVRDVEQRPPYCASCEDIG